MKITPEYANLSGLYMRKYGVVLHTFNAVRKATLSLSFGQHRLRLRVTW